MTETLIITGVDIKLLEEQRHTLAYIKNNPKLFPHLDPRRQEDIAGVSNMLDDWSDQRFFRKKSDAN